MKNVLKFLAIVLVCTLFVGLVNILFPYHPDTGKPDTAETSTPELSSEDTKDTEAPGKPDTTPESLISFTIDSIPYQAKEGMTWAEWAGSEYCTIKNIDVSGSSVCVYESSSVSYLYKDGTISCADQIISGASYTWLFGGHSGGNAQ